MQVLRSLHDLQDWRHSSEAFVHFVPTMGGLHQGHASLISAASRHKADEAKTLVSVFVNPLQFWPR